MGNHDIPEIKFWFKYLKIRNLLDKVMGFFSDFLFSNLNLS